MRDELLRFAIAVEEVLCQNDHKQGYEYLSRKWILHRMRQELGELVKAVKRGDDIEKIQKEAIDVAAFAMFLYDNLETEKEEQSP